MQNKYFFTTIFCFSTIFLFAQSKHSLCKAFKAFAADTAMRHASVGFVAQTAASGKIIYENQADLLLTPASNMKLVTTGAALFMLGSSFKYKTALLVATNKNNTLVATNQNNTAENNEHNNTNHTIYINGVGDPTLGSKLCPVCPSADSILFRWSSLLQNKNIKKIIVTEGAISDRPTEVIQIDDLPAPYGATASGLNFDDNTNEISILPNSSEKNISSYVLNNDYNIKINTDLLRYAPRKKSDYHVRLDYQTGALHFVGSFAADTLYEPVALLQGGAQSLGGRLYRNLLAQKTKFIDNNIDSVLVVSPTKMPSALLSHTLQIDEIASPNLQTIITYCNQNSINLYAEALLKTLGLDTENRGDAETGINVVVNFWRKRGLDMSGLQMRDGSGMSARNKVTPRFMVAMLQNIYNDKSIYANFYSSLPIAAQSGTIKNWFTNTAAAGKIRAKTGSIGGVLSYSGYATARNGEQIIFSLIVNNYAGEAKEMRQKMVNLLVKLCE